MEHPLKVIRDRAPDLMELADRAEALALSDGALPARIKLLVAMAIDLTLDAPGGVQVLARRAMEAGATREEVLETLRVAWFVGGQSKLYTGAEGLRSLLET